MSSFKGSYTYTVDAKGRVNLPSKLKKNVSPDARDQFVITFGVQQCLVVYPLDEWNVLESKLRGLNEFLIEPQAFLHVMLEHAEDTELDSQSRITIPQGHREYANIQNEVKIIGLLNKIEIWNPTLYEEYKKNNIKKSVAEMAADTMGKQ